MSYSLPIRTRDRTHAKSLKQNSAPLMMGHHIVGRPGIEAPHANGKQNAGRQMRHNPYPIAVRTRHQQNRRTPSRTRIPTRSRSDGRGTGANADQVQRISDHATGKLGRRASVGGLSYPKTRGGRKTSAAGDDDTDNGPQLGPHALQRVEDLVKKVETSVRAGAKPRDVDRVGAKQPTLGHPAIGVLDPLARAHPRTQNTADSGTNDQTNTPYNAYKAEKMTIDESVPNEIQVVNKLIREGKVRYRLCNKVDCCIKTTYKYHCGHDGGVGYQICTSHHYGWTSMTIWEPLCRECRGRASRHESYKPRDYLCDAADKQKMITSDEEYQAWWKANEELAEAGELLPPVRTLQHRDKSSNE